MKKISIGVFVFLLSTNVTANTTHKTCKLSKVTTHEVGNYALRLTCSGISEMCGVGTDSWVYYDKNNTNLKNYLSLALTALVADKQVQIREISQDSSRGPTRCNFKSIEIRK